MYETLRTIASQPIVWQIATGVISVICIVILSRFVRRRVNESIDDGDLRYRARQVLTISTWIVILGTLAVIFSNRLGGLTVGIGVAGAGIAFALQEVIGSFAGWVAISFGHFFSIGDRVQLGGTRGDVIDIGILRTTLMECGEWVSGDLYNGRIVRIANSFVFKEPVFNYSADFPFLWDEITIPIRHGSDHTLAREMIREVAEEIVGDFTKRADEQWGHVVRKYRIEDARTEPLIYMFANDNWLEFTLRYVVDYRMWRRTKDRIFTRLMEEIQASDGKVQIASATFDIVSTPPLDVRMQQAPD